MNEWTNLSWLYVSVFILSSPLSHTHIYTLFPLRCCCAISVTQNTWNTISFKTVLSLQMEMTRNTSTTSHATYSIHAVLPHTHHTSHTYYTLFAPSRLSHTIHTVSSLTQCPPCLITPTTVPRRVHGVPRRAQHALREDHRSTQPHPAVEGGWAGGGMWCGVMWCDVCGMGVM